MTFLVSALTWLADVVLKQLVGKAVSAVFSHNAPGIARWLVDCALGLLETTERERVRDEWTTTLEDIKKSDVLIASACSLLLGAASQSLCARLNRVSILSIQTDVRGDLNLTNQYRSKRPVGLVDYFDPKSPKRLWRQEFDALDQWIGQRKLELEECDQVSFELMALASSSFSASLFWGLLAVRTSATRASADDIGRYNIRRTYLVLGVTVFSHRLKKRVAGDA